MTGTSTTTLDALRALEQAIVPPRPGTPVGNWRWAVRQRLTGVREALASEDCGISNAWLSARNGSALRERHTLVSRVVSLGSDVLERPDTDRLRIELRRLVNDLNRHLQHLSDLAYDDVELELGGED